jgi:thioredoxin-like negative regulator of GroEL
MLLAEQRMFSQSDRMLGASNIALASIEVAYVAGHLSKRRFDKVRGHLDKARAAVPDHPLLDFLSSMVATDKAEELVYLEKVYAKDKRHFEVLTRLAKFYDEKGDSKATELLLAAADVNPKNTDMRLALAARFQKEGKTDQAREQYLALIEAVPFHEGALTFLAGDAQQRKDKPSELKYVQAMIKEIKDTKDRRAREAELLAQTNQSEAAEKAYKNLLERDPKMVAGNLYLAKVLLARGKPFKAIARYIKAGEAGRKELSALGERYEVGKPLPSKGRSLNPTIWAAEAKLKKRFAAARKRAPMIKGGRVSWTLIFDDQGQCVEVVADSKRVTDPWFLAGGVLLQLGVKHKTVAGGEISWDLSVP